MLHELLRPTLELDPARPIIESQGIWTTAGDLEQMASRLASGLVAAGLEEGDRVAVLGLVDAYPEFGRHLRNAMEQHSSPAVW